MKRTMKYKENIKTLLSDWMFSTQVAFNRSCQSKEGTVRALGMAGIEPTLSKSEHWTPLLP